MTEYSRRVQGSSTTVFLLILVVVMIIAGVAGGYIFYRQIQKMENEISSLKGQISNMWGFQNVTYQNITLYQNSTALVEIYEKVKDSIVLVHATSATESVQGSGFVYNYSGTMVVVTNYHVVHGAITLSVTFADANGYAAVVNGTDPYADLAVLVVSAPESEFKPLAIVSSSTLRVGDPVIAIGNPYGLVGSLTTGVVSAVGRTITEEIFTGGFAIANIIQTSAPINPGNSGGPLLNYVGNVVGITTAIINQSQGLGFAVPSNTIIREIASLVENGSYDAHSYLGIRGTDMSYEEAQRTGANVTYGWLIREVVAGGPCSRADVQVGDVIVGLNGTRIRNSDELSCYLEEKTLPDQNITLNIVRGHDAIDRQVQLGKRPSPQV